MDDNNVRVTHNGIEITYLEAEDNWVFELRGRYRTVSTLAKAKDAIDKEPVSKTEKPFEPFTAILWGLWEERQEVTVTSFDYQYGSRVARIKKPNGKRYKEPLTMLFTNTPGNLALMADYDKVAAEIKALTVKADKIKNQMEHVIGTTATQVINI